MANEHILQVQDGDTQTPVEIDLRGHAMSAGVSGHVAPGNYKCEIRAADWKNKKDDSSSKTFHASLTTAEPVSGVPVQYYQPAPAKGKFEEQGTRQFKDFVLSVAQAIGREEQATAGPIKISPQWFAGKQCYARIEDGKGEFSDRSSIARFITKAEYEASPGPDAEIGSTIARPQTSTPEVLPGAIPSNGTAPAAADSKRPVDRLLGF